MGHQVGGAFERAYRRTDFLDERRDLMDAWSSHCEPRDGSNVVEFKKPAGSAA